MGSTLGLQPDSGSSKMIMKSDTLSRILSDMCRPGALESVRGLMHRTLRAYKVWQRNGVDMATWRHFNT
jgi:hypothetical protein